MNFEKQKRKRMTPQGNRSRQTGYLVMSDCGKSQNQNPAPRPREYKEVWKFIYWKMLWLGLSPQGVTKLEI